jgi:hypothetical protein
MLTSRIRVTPARIALTLAILAQTALLVLPGSGREAYRHHERMAAFMEWKQSGSATAKAKFDAECVLADRHEERKRFVLVGGFFLINGALCCVFWNYGMVKKPS